MRFLRILLFVVIALGAVLTFAAKQPRPRTNSLREVAHEICNNAVPEIAKRLKDELGADKCIYISEDAGDYYSFSVGNTVRVLIWGVDTETKTCKIIDVYGPNHSSFIIPPDVLKKAPKP
ncbi:MAG: hypothetical protein ABL907_09505 [Hyphomicrobium sp.]